MPAQSASSKVPSERSPANNKASTPRARPGQSSTEAICPEPTVYGTPFERFRPLGGGADGDIFRRFNIRAAEEADVHTYRAETRTSAGIFARDASGTLAFRISSAHVTDLNNELDIGSPGTESQFARWIHVYDADGASWLTQFRPVDVEALRDVFDGAGRSVQHDGRLGLYGPSGQTVRSHVARRRIEAELARMNRY